MYYFTLPVLQIVSNVTAAHLSSKTIRLHALKHYRLHVVFKINTRCGNRFILLPKLN